MTRIRQSIRQVLTGLAILFAGGACRPEAEPSPKDGDRVTVYCSVDETIASVILADFESTSGIKVNAVYDSEAGKTTGLVQRIVREAQTGRPRAHVFWSGELFATMRLADEGFLEPYDPPTASDIPARYRDPQGRWTALAVRARVLAYDPQRTSADELPSRWEDLGKREFASRTAIANPLFGTTRGHIAATFALWGKDRGDAFLVGLRHHGALIVDGNSATVRAVMDGRVAFGLTDSDDVWMARRTGASIDARPLDMGDGGTLLIPCSVGLVKGGEARERARRLADFLVSAHVERALARSDSRNIPVRSALREELKMALPDETKLSFDAITQSLDEADRAVRNILVR